MSKRLVELMRGMLGYAISEMVDCDADDDTILSEDAQDSIALNFLSREVQD
jgi:hypothetical protein